MIEPDPGRTGTDEKRRAYFATGGNKAAYIGDESLWAYCTDATDKALVGGDGGAKLVSGQCRNEDNIIHLKWVETASQAPTGWTSVTTTIYYKLTPR